MKLNTRDMEIIMILACSESPMTSSQIVRNKGGLTQSTVQAVLRKLLNEDLVEVAGVTHSGNVLSRTFSISDKGRNVVEEKFIADFVEFKSIINKSAVVAGMLAAETDMDQRKKDIAEIESCLRELKKSLT